MKYFCEYLKCKLSKSLFNNILDLDVWRERFHVRSYFLDNKYELFFRRTQIGMSKPIYYAIDGTGRDSYISFNNGGLNRPIEENVYEIGNALQIIFRLI